MTFSSHLKGSASPLSASRPAVRPAGVVAGRPDLLHNAKTIDISIIIGVKTDIDKSHSKLGRINQLLCPDQIGRYLDRIARSLGSHGPLIYPAPFILGRLAICRSVIGFPLPAASSSVITAGEKMAARLTTEP